MGLHIATMNVIAPLLAACVVARWPLPGSTVAPLWTATLGQIALLWAWHAPAIHAVMMSHPWLAPGAHALLLLAALLFWGSLLSLSASQRWQAIPALMLTGKLVCLLAALLVFAPRALYAHALHTALDDQQLAGLLMIAACPVSYLVPAVFIAAQLITSPRRPGASPRGPLRAAG